MKKAFKIFKEGRTDGWVIILIEDINFTPSFIQKKINKYLMLGYQVKNID